jgi:hypothetical protein
MSSLAHHDNREMTRQDGAGASEFRIVNGVVHAAQRRDVASRAVLSPFGRRTDGVGGEAFRARARVGAPTSAL